MQPLLLLLFRSAACTFLKQKRNICFLNEISQGFIEVGIPGKMRACTCACASCVFVGACVDVSVCVGVHVRPVYLLVHILP